MSQAESQESHNGSLAQDSLQGSNGEMVSYRIVFSPSRFFSYLFIYFLFSDRSHNEDGETNVVRLRGAEERKGC